jgi:hypothetical protein
MELMRMFKFTLLLLVMLNASTTFSKTIQFNNELKVHIITPPIRINWKSPRSLSLTAGVNSMTDDYAPIGHFAVEVSCQKPNRYGIKHIATGMERISKEESKKITMEQKLGLKSLFYSFRGRLVPAKQTMQEVADARKQKRLTSVSIPISASRCESIMDFMDNWIESGSYTVYGGGKEVLYGEGSGCADFALEIFKIATDVEPNDDLFVKLYVPNKLIGSETQKVGFTKLLLSTQWAEAKDKNATYYVTPDTNRVADFVRKNSARTSVEYLYLRHLLPDDDFGLWPKTMPKFLIQSLNDLAESFPEYHTKNFEFKYKYQKTEPVRTTWDSIKI